MIIDKVLGLFAAALLLLFQGLPEIDSLGFDSAWIAYIFDILKQLGSLLPLALMLVLLKISLAIKGLEIAWAVILRIKSFIPTMGA